MSKLVRHVMTASPRTLGPQMNADDAAGLMKQADVGVIPVVDGDRLVGLVTDRDLVMRVLAERKEPTEVKLTDILTRSPVTVSPDMGLAQARELMGHHRIRRLLVMKGEELVGIISLGDLALADPSKRAIGDALEQVSVSESTQATNAGPEVGTPERQRR